MDIDDAQGFEHIFQVLGNTLTGEPTNPYNIHEVLLAAQHLDPGYDVVLQEAAATPKFGASALQRGARARVDRVRIVRGWKAQAKGPDESMPPPREQLNSGPRTVAAMR